MPKAKTECSGSTMFIGENCWLLQSGKRDILICWIENQYPILAHSGSSRALLAFGTDKELNVKQQNFIQLRNLAPLFHILGTRPSSHLVSLLSKLRIGFSKKHTLHPRPKRIRVCLMLHVPPSNVT